MLFLRKNSTSRQHWVLFFFERSRNERKSAASYFYPLQSISERRRRTIAGSTCPPSFKLEKSPSPLLKLCSLCYFCMYSSMPKWLPSGSNAKAHQPSPGISILGTTILPPNDSIFLLYSSTDSTEI